jgi:hypothetical protein
MISSVRYFRIINHLSFSFCAIEAWRINRWQSWMFFILFYLLISFWVMFYVPLQIMADGNLEDSDIEPAPKLIEVVFQNCKGQVDQWVEPYMRITVQRLRRTDKLYLKCLLMQVVRSYNVYKCFDMIFLFWVYFTLWSPYLAPFFLSWIDYFSELILSSSLKLWIFTCTLFM